MQLSIPRKNFNITFQHDYIRITSIILKHNKLRTMLITCKFNNNN